MTDKATEIAREACARHFDERGAHHTANRFREGKRDDCPYMETARIAAELATMWAHISHPAIEVARKANLRAHIDGRHG